MSWLQLGLSIKMHTCPYRFVDLAGRIATERGTSVDHNLSMKVQSIVLN